MGFELSRYRSRARPVTSGLIAIVRPVNLILTFVSVLVGGALSDSSFRVGRVLIAALSGSLIAGGGNALNDVCDVDIDRIGKPWRPIPAGEVSPRGGLAWSVLLFALGILLSISLGTLPFIVAASASLGLILYDVKLKRTLVVGNIVVGLISGLAFIYGASAVGGLGTSPLLGAFAFLFHFGREVMKDTEDREEDSVSSAVTIPVRFGKRAALQVVTASYLLLIGLTVGAYWVADLGRAYLAIVIPGVDLVLGGVIWSMWRDSSKENLKFLSSVLKADMALGMAAVFFGSL